MVPLRHLVLLAARDVGEVCGRGKVSFPRRSQVLDHLEQGALRLGPDVIDGSVLVVRQVGVGVDANALGEQRGELVGDVLRRDGVVLRSAQVRVSHRHPVLRERPRLVRVELRGAAHRLARLQAPHEVLIRHHLAHGEREAEGDGQGKALGDGDHDYCDGVDEVIQNLDAVPSLTLGSVDDPADHGRDERGDRGADAKVTYGHHQHVEPVLQRRGAGLNDEGL